MLEHQARWVFQAQEGERPIWGDSPVSADPRQGILPHPSTVQICAFPAGKLPLEAAQLPPLTLVWEEGDAH